jgi:hypothetical protein
MGQTSDQQLQPHGGDGAAMPTEPFQRSQRRHPRWPVSIDCQVEGASVGSSMRLSELSVGGCYVDTRVDFRQGTPVTITAAFPASEVVFTGTVLYVHSGYGFGVGFDALAEQTREELEEFLRRSGE